MLAAVNYLHSLGVAHRDMKPSNVLLDSKNNVKVSDFGLGSFFGDSNKLNTPCGSPCFAAPEVISGFPYQPEPYDMWGLGVILFNLLTGVLPFDEPTKAELYAKIRSASYNIPVDLPAGPLRIIKRLLVRDPNKRMKITEIWQDEWIQRGGGGQILSHFKREEVRLGRILLAPDHRIIVLAAHLLGNVTPEKMCSMLHKREKNKMTMTYWLMLQKSRDGNLTEEEQLIIQQGQKDINLLDSTAADLLERKSSLNRTLGGTGSTVKKSTRKMGLDETKDKRAIRLPNIIRNTSLETIGSIEISKDTPKYVINRGKSKDKLMMIFESPSTTPLSHT